MGKHDYKVSQETAKDSDSGVKAFESSTTLATLPQYSFTEDGATEPSMERRPTPALKHTTSENDKHRCHGRKGRGGRHAPWEHHHHHHRHRSASTSSSSSSEDEKHPHHRGGIRGRGRWHGRHHGFHHHGRSPSTSSSSSNSSAGSERWHQKKKEWKKSIKTALRKVKGDLKGKKSSMRGTSQALS